VLRFDGRIASGKRGLCLNDILVDCVCCGLTVVRERVERLVINCDIGGLSVLGIDGRKAREERV
jgi:hypothetical protein